MNFQDMRWLLDILDVAIVTFLIYHIFLLVRGTRAAQMFLGLIAILLLSALADLFRLTALNWILASLKTVWVVAFLILFQPELRRGLTMIGHSRLFRRIFRLEEGSHLGEIEDALLNLRKRGLGAIVVLERNTGLRSYIETGTMLESNLSAELLETIFIPPAPLHDGAVIIRGNHVIAAGCILPLSQSMALDRSLGTRHRAILGVSEETDAVAIAVSEETRQIAIAEGGRLIRNVDPTTLKAVLSQFIRAPKEREERKEERSRETVESAAPVASEERRRSTGVPRHEASGMSHALNRDRVFLASILLLAAALRVWTVLVLRNDLRISEPVIDGQLYLESARALAGGSFNPHTVFFQSPLYPLVLSSLVRSTTAVTSTVLGVQILQTILGLGTGVLLFLAARRRAGSAVARIAALLWLLYGPILEMESEVVPTTLLLFLATAALWLWPRRDGVASRPQGSGRHWKPVAFGVVCGLLVVGRGTYALLPVLAFGAWMLGSRRQARPAASGLARQVALVGIGTAVIIAPLSVYQTRAAGQLVLLTPNGGLNLFIGNNPAARGIYSNPPELDIESDFTGTRSASLLAGRTLTIAESSRFWAARSVGFLTQDPGRAAWLLGRKILLYFSPREIPQIENFSRIATDTPPLRVAFLRFGWILPFAVWGAVSGLARRRRRSTQAAETVERWPFVALVVTGWIATIVFFAAARYRIPMVPGFLVLAAIGIVELWRNRRTPGRLLPGTAVIVAVAALLTVLPSYPVARADANSDYLLGLRLSRNGQHEDAIRIFHRALELDPASGEAWHGIGVAMAAQGRLTEATEAYRHALETMPLSTWTYYNLGVCLEQLERFSEAAEAFGAAVSLQPDDANLRYRWGAVLARLGRTADAVEQLESAVRIDSGLQPATALLRRLRAEQEGN